MQMMCSLCDLSDAGKINCAACRYQRLDILKDDVFVKAVRPLSYCCAIVILLGYILGLCYVLFTHKNAGYQSLLITPEILAEISNASEEVRQGKNKMDGNEHQEASDEGSSIQSHGENADADNTENSTAGWTQQVAATFMLVTFLAEVFAANMLVKVLVVATDKSQVFTLTSSH